MAKRLKKTRGNLMHIYTCTCIFYIKYIYIGMGSKGLERYRVEKGIRTAHLN